MSRHSDTRGAGGRHQSFRGSPIYAYASGTGAASSSHILPNPLLPRWNQTSSIEKTLCRCSVRDHGTTTICTASQRHQRSSAPGGVIVSPISRQCVTPSRTDEESQADAPGDLRGVSVVRARASGTRPGPTDHPGVCMEHGEFGRDFSGADEADQTSERLPPSWRPRPPILSGRAQPHHLHRGLDQVP